MWEKIKSSALIFIAAGVGPEILSITGYPIEMHHRAGCFLLGCAAVLQISRTIWQRESELEQVLEAKMGESAPRLERVK